MCLSVYTRSKLALVRLEVLQQREGQKVRPVQLRLVSEQETVYSAMESGCAAVGDMTSGVNARGAADSGYSEAANGSQGLIIDSAGVTGGIFPPVLDAWVAVELYKMLKGERKTGGNAMGYEDLVGKQG